MMEENVLEEESLNKLQIVLKKYDNSECMYIFIYNVPQAVRPEGVQLRRKDNLVDVRQVVAGIAHAKRYNQNIVLYRREYLRDCKHFGIVSWNSKELYVCLESHSRRNK